MPDSEVVSHLYQLGCTRTPSVAPTDASEYFLQLRRRFLTRSRVLIYVYVHVSVCRILMVPVGKWDPGSGSICVEMGANWQAPTDVGLSVLRSSASGHSYSTN